jgi:hypothetical protein
MPFRREVPCGGRDCEGAGDESQACARDRHVGAPDRRGRPTGLRMLDGCLTVDGQSGPFAAELRFYQSS